MKEIKEAFLKFQTGSQTLNAPANANFVAAYYCNGIQLLYEVEATEAKFPKVGFVFHIRAPFDLVPVDSKYIGTIPDDESVFHIYLED